MLLGAAALGATAVLAGLPPSASVAEASKLQRPPAVEIEGADDATSVRLRLVVSPASPGPNRFDATVLDYHSRQPVAAGAVSLRLQPKDRPDTASSTVALTRNPDSHWQGISSAISIDGRWTITAVVQSATDVVVEVPMELTTR